MTATTAKNSHHVLNQQLQNMLSDASISIQSLPQCEQIKLWLIEPQAMQRPFDQNEVLAIQTYPAYWAFCWASGQLLAREILANPDWVKDKKVMDFGAGSGVVAIACALAGAREVIACDIDPDALLACQANAELNQVAQLEHTHFRLHNDLFDFNEELDLLIAADVLYDKANLPLLNIFNEKATQVLVADSRVKKFNFPPYHKIASFESFTVPDLDESSEFRRVNLYKSN